MWISTGLLLAGALFLAIGAEALVRGAAAIAARIGMPALLIGLTVVAFGTSAPELVATLRAALLGSSGMAIGNVIGSNIANVALVLGMAAAIRPLRVAPQIVRIDAPIALAISILLVVFMRDRSLDRLEGLFLFAGLLVYTYFGFLRHRSNLTLAIETGVNEENDEPEIPVRSFWVSIPLTLVGLVALAYGADLFVDGARRLAIAFGVPEAVIGLTIMALGTSLPEIATVVAASLKGMSDLITGNVVGSNIFNTLCVLGLTASFIPLQIGAITAVDLSVFVGSAVVIWIAMATRNRLSRVEGLLLLAGYVLYVSYLF